MILDIRGIYCKFRVKPAKAAAKNAENAAHPGTLLTWVPRRPVPHLVKWASGLFSSTQEAEFLMLGVGGVSVWVWISEALCSHSA